MPRTITPDAVRELERDLAPERALELIPEAMPPVCSDGDALLFEAIVRWRDWRVLASRAETPPPLESEMLSFKDEEVPRELRALQWNRLEQDLSGRLPSAEPKNQCVWDALGEARDRLGRLPTLTQYRALLCMQWLVRMMATGDLTESYIRGLRRLVEPKGSLERLRRNVHGILRDLRISRPTDISEWWPREVQDLARRGGSRRDSTLRSYSDADPKRTLNLLLPEDEGAGREPQVAYAACHLAVEL